MASTDDVEKARGLRLLVRYTRKKWARAEEWRVWLERERFFLFFSDWDGFRFHSSRRSLDEQRKQLEKGPGVPAPTDDAPALTHYIGDVCFLREVRLGQEFVPGTKLALEVTWQACDDHQCLPPDERKLEVALSNRVAGPTR